MFAGQFPPNMDPIVLPVSIAEPISQLKHRGNVPILWPELRWGVGLPVGISGG